MLLLLYKSRQLSKELQILQILNQRMTLSEKDKRYFQHLTKGYEGEKHFDALTETISSQCYILNDLLLQQNNTTFQIDTLILFQEAIFIFEVKNYSGDFYYEKDRLYKEPQFEIQNPLNQLQRTESLLRQLLRSIECSLPIEAFIVFIHPEFTLYQAPRNQQFIFPTQIHQTIQKFNEMPSTLHQQHKQLADELLALHIENTSFSQYPLYTHEQLKKGIICNQCASFSISIQYQVCICEQCGHKELVSTVVLQAIRDYQLLFPNEKITTNRIYDWCGTAISRKRIQAILAKNFMQIGVKQWAYYK